MLRVCGNREDAEDVLIEAPLKAYCSLEQLRDSASFKAWLAQIARRVCWQLKQHEALLPLLQLSEMETAGHELHDKAPAPEEIVSAAQMKQLLQQAVARLAPEFRAVYQLRDLDELPGDEVAAMLGISLTAMKSRLHRARSMLREHIEAAMLGKLTAFDIAPTQGDNTMEVHVEHLGAVQFEIKARQHTIACDQPEALGGFDEGMTPPELLLSALASCAAYYAVAYLKEEGPRRTWHASLRQRR